MNKVSNYLGIDIEKYDHQTGHLIHQLYHKYLEEDVNMFNTATGRAVFITEVGILDDKKLERTITAQYKTDKEEEFKLLTNQFLVTGWGNKGSYTFSFYEGIMEKLNTGNNNNNTRSNFLDELGRLEQEEQLQQDERPHNNNNNNNNTQTNFLDLLDQYEPVENLNEGDNLVDYEPINSANAEDGSLEEAGSLEDEGSLQEESNLQEDPESLELEEPLELSMPTMFDLEKYVLPPEDSDTVSEIREEVENSEESEVVGNNEESTGFEESEESNSVSEYEESEEVNDVNGERRTIVSAFEGVPESRTNGVGHNGELPINHVYCVERSNGQGESVIEVTRSLNHAVAHLKELGYGYNRTKNVFHKRDNTGRVVYARVYIDLDFRGVLG